MTRRRTKLAPGADGEIRRLQSIGCDPPETRPLSPMLVRFLSIVRDGLKRAGLLPWIKRLLYTPTRGDAGGRLARGWRYRLKLLIEQANFASAREVHDLPPIHHYWSNHHLIPFFETLGFRTLEQFWLNEIGATLGPPALAGTMRILSLGSGNCDFEVTVARRLKAMGYAAFRIDCMDINSAMLERGVKSAQSAGVAQHIAALHADFNSWRGAREEYRVVLANQALHHVVNLEDLFDAVHEAIGRQGRFIISDMVGRNGHMRWPEALQIVDRLWSELPPSYRFDRTLGMVCERYANVDCSRAGFEGIRAQDILPLLIERFGFSLFVPFANVIDVFVGRAIGPNFDPEREWDCAFIDRVHAADVEALRTGCIKPTHLMASMTTDRAISTRCPEGLTPSASVRPP